MITPDKQKLVKQLAAEIHAYLQSDIRHDRTKIPRPFCIEFTGSPSAGKTTIITELDKFFRRQDFRVWRPQEGAEVIRHIPRTTPLYNLRTAIYALTNLIDESAGNKYDIIFFDRCVFDAYCWMIYWEEKGKLSQEEKELFQKFFLSPFWAGNIDLAFIVTCETEEAMRRELRIAVTNELGETTNPATVEKLVRRYTAAHEILAPVWPQLYLFDTTRLNEREMVERVTDTILNALIKKIRR